MTDTNTLDVLGDTGRYLVETAHSSYMIDMDAKTYERRTVHADANALPSFTGRPLPFVGIDCHLDECMFIAVGGGGAYIRSTPVASIWPAA